MNELNASLNAVEWWRMLVVGFLLGVGFTAVAIWAFSQWAQRRPYMPGPFARHDISNYRLSPPRD